MSSKKLFEELNLFLTDYEVKLSEKVFDKSLCTIEFVKIIDYLYLTSLCNKDELNKSLIVHYLRAWPNILSICYEDFKRDEYPLFRTSDELERFSHQVFWLFSKTCDVKRLLSMTKYNLVGLKKIKDKEYEFNVMVEGYPIEQEERNDYFKFMEEQPKVIAFTENIEDVHKIMEKMVYVYKNHYIGYSTNKEIDDFYLVLGTCISDTYWGKHDFPKDAMFGGVKYVDYIASIVVFIGITLKHLNFCNLLIRQNPNIKLIDILNVFHTIEEEIETLTTALNISEDTAKIIMDVLTYNQNDLSDSVDDFNNTYPMFLKVANKMLLRTNLAFLTDPFMCLLQQLSRRFPRDWSREINTREQIFRTQLYDTIKDSDIFIKIDKNINIYEDKRRLTDIDALVIDTKSKTMAVFQLKWQEPFGGSMSERNSKKNNFITASNKWIDDVSNWLSTSTIKDKADVFGVKKEILNGDWKYKLFVVGRHFSHFSDCNHNNEKAAWCNWYKLNEICKTLENATYDNYFETLYSKIKSEYEIARRKKAEVDSDCIQLENYKFFVRSN